MNNIFKEFLSELIISDNFNNLYYKLRNNYIKKFLNIDIEEYKFNFSEIKKILEYSSLLAMSNNFFHIEISQKINSFLFSLYRNDNKVLFGIQMIYVRIGNFPVLKQQDIFGENELILDNKNLILDNELIGEFINEKNKSREIIGEKERYINKFQKDILEDIKNNDIISISAPTSFGKSFVIRTYISKIFAEKSDYTILIIVPTKALINDFLLELLSIKKEFGFSYNVITHFINDEESIKNKIFILTQERLSATLRKNPSILECIDLFYCDEAHKVSYTGRGFLLRKVIEEFSKYNINGKKIFTSPIIRNPEYFVNKFFSNLVNLNTKSRKIDYKPVEKNIFLYALNKNYINYDIYFYDNIKNSNYGKEKLCTKLDFIHLSNDKELYNSDKSFYKLDVVINSNFEGNTIIYISSKAKLILYAKYLLGKIDKNNKIPNGNDLKEIKDYIDENFYNGLYILDFLKEGIGIHAGFLPIGLRNKIVELFKDGKLRYILCTSTLLEGVNLPIKNIVILNNNSGAGNLKFGKIDFLNLIGRAGRFSYELSGNVILFADDKINMYDGYFNINEEDLIIKDVEENTLNDNRKKKELFKFFEYENYDGIYSKNERDSYEFIFYSLFEGSNEINKLGLKNEEKELILNKINTFKLNAFYTKNIYKENLGISPISQEKLYNKLNSYNNKELLYFYEVVKDKYKINGDFYTILDLLQIIFFVKKVTRYKSFESKKEFTKIINWISGNTLQKIISTEIFYYKKGYTENNVPLPNQKKIDEKVLEFITYYTNTIGFSWVKYLRVFYNILFIVFEEKGLKIEKEEYEKTIESFLFTLETGIDSQLGKYLYSLGLPRSICIKVNKTIAIFTKNIEEYNKENIDNLFTSKRVKAFLKIRLSKIAYTELYRNLDL